MLYPSEERLSTEASARLATLADHTELGSGFRIAMRDLELRGAGNLLGDEQSGHVAAVGFELYVAMLEEAVEAVRSGGEADGPEEQLRLDLSVDAYLPTEYVPFEAAKIDVHRRIAGAREPGELRALRDELRDRFGPLPEPVASLLELGRLRIELTRAGVRVAEVRGGRFGLAGGARLRGRCRDPRADPRGDLRDPRQDPRAQGRGRPGRAARAGGRARFRA